MSMPDLCRSNAYFIINFISLSVISQVIFMCAFRFLRGAPKISSRRRMESLRGLLLNSDEPARELRERQRRTAQAATHNQ
jgi:hypothetical protein